jgi:hypothetical protein
MMTPKMPADRLAAAVVAVLVAAAAARADSVVLPSVRDNTLIQNASGSLSNGAGAHFFVGLTEQPARRRGLLAFDVAAVPPGSTVQSVTLELFMSRTVVGPKSVSLHAVTADWGEGSSDAPGQEGAGAPAMPGDATWLHRFFDTELWTTEGGDYVASPSATIVVGGVGPYVLGPTPQMVADVQAWIDDPASAFGWILVGDESGGPSAKRFDSRENALPDRRPRLAIEFTPPGGGSFFYFADADGDGFGNPNVVTESPDPEPPPGFVIDNTDCDDTDPAVNPAADEVCDNGIDDDCDGFVDGCGSDCNGNGTPDFLDILNGTSLDCNANGVPDSCDIASGAASDVNGNLIPDVCEVSCCDSDDLRSLTFQYTSMSCAATSHGQDDGDVTCIDYGPLPETVYVLVTDEEEPDDPDAAIWFQGPVTAGGMFVADALAGGEDELNTRTSVHIFSADASTVLQSVEFRTNCSDPVAVGDQFGASLVVACLGVGGSSPCPADLDGDGGVGVQDLMAVIIAWGTSDPAADATADGTVDVNDLLAVVTLWGPCPQ